MAEWFDGRFVRVQRQESKFSDVKCGRAKITVQKFMFETFEVTLTEDSFGNPSQ